MINKIPKILTIVALVIYILNPTAGIIELLPDNLPWVGNLDEAAAVALIIKLVNSLRQEEKEKK